MAILNNNPLVGASGNQGGYNINNSLRFRSSASAYLSRTPASAGNRKTWTWSGWVKRGSLGSTHTLLSTTNGSGTYTEIRLINDVIGIQSNSIAAPNEWLTNAVFRDPSAWYHIVVALDTTAATAADRIKVWVNSNTQTFSQSPTVTLNGDLYINAAVSHSLGRRDTGSLYFDGYLAEVNFIDGSAKTPSDFGETDTTTGVWKPKAYTGTYGTNGFYLKFSDIATTSGSNAGLGKDFSGNSNYWTTNNISVTSGTTYDAMTDSPTNTSATVANYAVMSPLAKYSGVTASGGNLNVTSSTQNQGIAGTIYANSGKWYAEFTCNSNGLEDAIGILQDTYNFQNSGFYQATQLVVIRNSASVYYSSSASVGAPTWVSGDIVQVKLDLDNQTVGWAVNGGSYTTISMTSYDSHTAGQYWTFGVKNGNTGGNGNFNYSANFGQRPFSYTPPTGFVALNTYNLPDSTIKKGNKYMDATLYTGNSSTQTVTNAGSFKPDFVWIKDRTTAYPNMLFDSVRGASKRLISNTTDTEATETDTQTSFNSNGFSVSTNLVVNRSSDAFVGWQWQAGQGSTSSNTQGSITSTVSVNTTAGFSIVTFSNTTTGSTIGHGLGVAPKMMIVKDRGSVSNWQVYHASLGNNAQLRLNTTDAQNTPSNLWNTTTPTSTVFTFGSGFAGSYSYVVYCWAEIAGFSKFGSYTGNSSTDGPFIYTGFRPKFVLFKISSGSTGNWFILDTLRSTYNEAVNLLNPDTSDAAADVSPFIDILSNGIKIRRNSVGLNNSGYTYIYAAFAESPFKNSLAR